MVRSRVDIKESSVYLLRNIENFLLLEMGRHNVDYNDKQKFKRQLWYAIFILHQQEDDDVDNVRQHLWVSARDLLESENDITRMTNSFISHRAMYARALFNFHLNHYGEIYHIDRFFDGRDIDNTNMEISSSSDSSSSSSSTAN